MKNCRSCSHCIDNSCKSMELCIRGSGWIAKKEVKLQGTAEKIREKLGEDYSAFESVYITTGDFTPDMVFVKHDSIFHHVDLFEGMMECTEQACVDLINLATNGSDLVEMRVKFDINKLELVFK